MRFMRYDVTDGCRQREVDGAKKPRWAAYREAEMQLADIVETVNGRMGQAVKEAWLETAKAAVHIGLLYADSTMVAGMLRNGALDRELTAVTTRFGYAVELLETNIGTLLPGQRPVITVKLKKVNLGFAPPVVKKTSAKTSVKTKKKATKKKVAKKTSRK